MEIELWLDTRQYLRNKLENFCHCQAPSILNSEKDKFLCSYFVLVSIYNLVHLPPLTPLFCCLNTIYTNCQIADSEVFNLETVLPCREGGGEGGEGGSVFPANDIQDVLFDLLSKFWSPLALSSRVKIIFYSTLFGSVFVLELENQPWLGKASKKKSKN